MKKKVLYSFLIIVLALAFVGCGNEQGGAQKTPGETGQITLKLGHVAAEFEPYNVAAKGFAEEIEKETNGKIKVEVYPSGLLGDERSLYEQVQVGSLDMAVGSSGVAANFARELSVLEFPFLFTDIEHARRVIDGELGTILKGKLDNAGFKCLGVWEFGMKNISNTKKEIRSRDDLKDFKMRVLENPIILATHRALGSNPTPIPTSEVYTALQQGVVDGFDGSYVTIYGQRLYEVLKYVSELNTSYGASLFVMNKAKFESFDPEIQKIVLELGEKWTIEERNLNQKAIEEYRQICIDQGVKIIPKEEIDMASFQEVTDKVAEQFPEYSELLNIIKNTN